MNEKMKQDAGYAFSTPKMYDRVSRALRGKRAKAILGDYLGEKKLSQMKALDVGCSTGILDNELGGGLTSLTGVDIDREAIRYAQEHFGSKKLKFILGDAMNLRFKDAMFDLVICCQTYEHVPDAQRLFDEIYRVLKPHGVCYLTAVNKWRVWEPHHNLPFLSWFPRDLVPWYKEQPKSYKELRNLASKFQLVDYTGKIISNPKKYHYDFPKILPPIIFIVNFLSPSFIWILQK